MPFCNRRLRSNGRLQARGATCGVDSVARWHGLTRLRYQLQGVKSAIRREMVCFGRTKRDKPKVSQPRAACQSLLCCQWLGHTSTASDVGQARVKEPGHRPLTGFQNKAGQGRGKRGAFSRRLSSKSGSMSQHRSALPRHHCAVERYRGPGSLRTKSRTGCDNCDALAPRHQCGVVMRVVDQRADRHEVHLKALCVRVAPHHAGWRVRFRANCRYRLQWKTEHDGTLAFAFSTPSGG